MTTSKLPKVWLKCRNDHDFGTRAKAGQSVRCHTCGVNRRVPADRPRTEREALEWTEPAVRVTAPASAPAARADAGTEADPWDQLAPWDERLIMRPHRSGPGIDDCEKCGGKLQWEPGRTMVYCPGCKGGLCIPPAIDTYYDRAEAQSAEVATRAAPDESAGRAARVRLRAMARRISDRVTEVIEALDPGEIGGNAGRLALDYQAELAAWLPEIRQAKAEAELTGIVAEIREVTDRAQRSGVLAELNRQREAAEQQDGQAAERESQWEAERAELAERRTQAERRAIEAPAARPDTSRGRVVIPGYIGLACYAIDLVKECQGRKTQGKPPEADPEPGPAEQPSYTRSISEWG